MASSDKPTMTSSKSSLLGALYRWIVDNKCTPYVLVNAFANGVEVPQEHVKDGQIVLNVAPSAIANLHIRREGISFNARFGGIPMDIYAPMPAVLGIYARENGQGMMFEVDSDEPEPNPDGPRGPKLVSSKPGVSASRDKPSLRVIK